MKKVIVEWFAAVGLCFLILVALALGGVLLSSLSVAATIVFCFFVIADVVIGACHGLSSLFRRSEATTGRREEDEG